MTKHIKIKMIMLQLFKYSFVFILPFLLSCTESSVDDYTPEGNGNTTEKKLSDEELMDKVQKETFKYFWDFAHPTSGLTRERSNEKPDTVTTGGTGFGVMAIIVGVERNYITRTEAVQRLNKMTHFLEDKAERYHGVWPHWLRGSTGKTVAFSHKDNGADLVETAFLIQGLLTVREYFDQENESEKELRETITRLWHDVEWDWFAQSGEYLLWHWSPNFHFEMNMPLRAFNETHIAYILALASPTHAINKEVYEKGWMGDNYVKELNPLNRGDFGGPLFFTHYSYLGLSPHITDKYMQTAGYASYFDRNKKQTNLNREWCKSNQSKYSYYGDKCWGLTASDNPKGYKAHAPQNDDGTITPTAALSSIVYTPEYSLKAMRFFYEEMDEYNLFGKYGFKDAFNISENWVANSYLAIDQGPIVVMIENYRTGIIWDTFMKNPEINIALEKAGLTRTK